MRKICLEIIGAIHKREFFSSGNTVFKHDNEKKEWVLYFHGNPIATWCDKHKKSHRDIPSYVSYCGYPTLSTSRRLNALDGVLISYHKEEDQVHAYLNGREIDIDGWWSPCNLNYTDGADL